MRKISTGISDYKEIIEENYSYIDKTQCCQLNSSFDKYDGFLAFRP